MDVLKDKSTKYYSRTSRYATFPYYYNTIDDKYMYGLTGQLSDETPYVLHTVEANDSADKLAYKYYGSPDFYWVILDVNRIQDSFEELYPKYKTLKIPTITAITFKE